MDDPDRLRSARSGESVTVPIGKTIFTNKRTVGQKLTTPDLVVLRAYEEDGKKAVRDPQSNRLFFTDKETINDRLIAEASYKQGAITVVRNNGEEFYIDGFPVLSDFGVGPTGPRGNPGKSGSDGKSGFDGNDGDIGCAGPKGEEGSAGAGGKDGKEGDQGSRGPDGCDGTRGENGTQGPMGIIGYEGERGAAGPVCASVSGGSGSTGAALRTNVVISTNAPDNLTVLWGIPQ